MSISSEFMSLFLRFGFNLFIAFIIIKIIYHKNHKDNDFVFTYFMFNALIFFFSYILGNININLGFAFGLFAVFAIMRYRTDPIPIKEMTYLFIVVAIGVINALSKTEISYDEILFTNFVIVGLTYLLESYWQKNLLIVNTVVYEKVENLNSENHDALLADLKERTGLNIKQFEIRRINFLQDTFNIKIYSKEDDT